MKDKQKNSGAAKKLMLPISLAMLALVYTAVLICVSLKYANEHLSDGTGISGSAIFLIIAFVTYAVYLVLDKKEILRTPRRMLLICVCILACSLISMLTLYVSTGFSPMLLAVLLIALLVDKDVASATALLCGAISGSVLTRGAAFGAGCKKEILEENQKICAAFRERFGAVRCEELKASGCVCDELIAFMAEKTEESLKAKK